MWYANSESKQAKPVDRWSDVPARRIMLKAGPSCSDLRVVFH